MNRRREKKILKLCKFYGIEMDLERLRIERINYGAYGGVICIYRSINTELLLKNDIGLGFYDDIRNKRHHDKKTELAERSPAVMEKMAADFKKAMSSVFRAALLKPDMERFDPGLLCDNPEIGAPLYTDIIASSVGLKKKLKFLTWLIGMR